MEESIKFIDDGKDIEIVWFGRFHSHNLLSYEWLIRFKCDEGMVNARLQRVLNESNQTFKCNVLNSRVIKYLLKLNMEKAPKCHQIKPENLGR